MTLLSSVPTASPAESFALRGTTAYVCDDNEVTIVNAANPSSLQVQGTAVSTLIKTPESFIAPCSATR